MDHKQGNVIVLLGELFCSCIFIEGAPSYDQFQTNIRSTVTMLKHTLQLVLTSTHEFLEEEKTLWQEDVSRV
jgi:hypothetical protein